MCGLKKSSTIYIICEVQASKARRTPLENRYISQTGPIMTKVKTQKVNYLGMRSYLSKNLKSHFLVKFDQTSKNDQDTPMPKF